MTSQWRIIIIQMFESSFLPSMVIEVYKVSSDCTLFLISTRQFLLALYSYTGLLSSLFYQLASKSCQLLKNQMKSMRFFWVLHRVLLYFTKNTNFCMVSCWLSEGVSMLQAPTCQVLLWHLLKESCVIRRNISATINFFPHNRAFMIMILICLFSEKGTFLVTAWWLDVYGRQFPGVYLEQSAVGWKWADIRISSVERSSNICGRSLGKEALIPVSASLCVLRYESNPEALIEGWIVPPKLYLPLVG